MIDEMTVTRLVHASPQKCYEVVADIANYPSWASNLSGVTVLERDEQDRPAQAAFQISALGRSARYTLAYDYSQSPDRISWQLVEGDIIKRLDGFYGFESAPEHEDATMLTYRLELELAVPMPGFVKRRAESRITHVAVDDLKNWLESA